MRTPILATSVPLALAAALFSSAGCGSSSSGSGGGTTTTTAGSTTGTGGSGGAADPCDDAAVTAGCATLLKPSGGDDSEGVLTAFIEATSGSTICFCPGNFSFSQQLSLTVPSVTVKGVGANIDDTVLDFSKVASGGNDTMLVTADHFTIENLAVRNTPGNGVVVRQSDSPTFRKLHVKWDSADLSKHGAYAVYPAECTNVLVEDCEVEGAADAAIYVGQGTGAILRRNKAHDSVLGIELENTSNGEAYENETWNNSAGMAVFLLGNLTKKTADKNLIHDNKIHDNNGKNFGDPKTVVSGVPQGTGVIVVGTSNTEIRANDIHDNDSTAVLVVSYSLMKVLIPGVTDDPNASPYPTNVFIHGNTYTNNGNTPHSALQVLGVTPLETVLWDGWVASGMPATNDAKFCLGSMAPFPSFRMFDGSNIAGTPVPSTDTTPYQCDLPEIVGTK